MQYLAQAETGQTINTTVPYTAPSTQKQNSSLLLPLILVAVISILVVTALIWIMKKRKKSAPGVLPIAPKEPLVPAGPTVPPSPPENSTPPQA